MAYYAYISEVRASTFGLGAPFYYTFEYTAFDDTGLVVSVNAAQGQSLDSTNWINDTNAIYDNFKDDVVTSVFNDVGIDIPRDHIYFVGQPDTFTFPDTVQVNSDGLTLLGGAFIFLAAMFGIMFYFRRK